MKQVDKTKLLSKFYIVFNRLLFYDLYYFKCREWTAVKRQACPYLRTKCNKWAAFPSYSCRRSRRRVYVGKFLSYIWVYYCGFLSLSLGSGFSRLYFDSLRIICLKSASVIKNNTSDYWCLVVSLIKMTQL